MRRLQNMGEKGKGERWWGIRWCGATSVDFTPSSLHAQMAIRFEYRAVPLGIRLDGTHQNVVRNENCN